METSSPTKSDRIRRRIQRLQVFGDVQKELGFAIAALERQTEVVRDARIDRDKARADYEDGVALEIVRLRTEKADESVAYLEHEAVANSVPLRKIALDAEAVWRQKESRLSVLNDYLRALEILSNNMRAELKLQYGKELNK